MQLLHDLRFSLRQLRKAPVFTLVAVVTLALGIGANTAIFTLLDQALLRSLPVSHPEQLVRLQFTGSTRGHFNTFGGDDHGYFSYPMYRDLRDQSSVFDSLIASDLQNVSVQWNNKPDLVGCELASGNYFQALGLQPAMGRLFLPADDVPNSSPVVVLSFNYWKRQFGSDPGVINQTLLINTHPFTIVGVAPPGFHSIVAGATEEVFVPLTTKNIITPRWQDLDDFNSHWMMVVGRLKPGVSRGQAEASLQPLWHALRAAELAKIPNASEHLRRTYLDESHILVLDSARGFSPLRDQIGTPVMIVMGMVVLLLLMACVNVSSLLLVRAAGRVREMSVRYAMGAGRWQIIRQLLAEGLLLGLLGGALGLLMAPAVSSLLIHRIAGDTAPDLPFSSSVDARILLFTFALALVVSLLFSLAPALRFLHPDLANSLKQQSTTSGGGQLRFRRALVAVQIGLSLLLLVGAGLFVRTLHNLRTLDVGFATDHLVSFGINPRLAGYQTDQVFPLYRRVLQTLSALPGTRAVAGTDDPDLANDNDSGNIVIAGYNDREDEDMDVEQPAVTPGYFATMGARRHQAHGVPPALPTGQSQRAGFPGAHLAAAGRGALRDPRRHAATRFQTGAERSADHGRADCRQPLGRAPDCLAGHQLRRAGHSAGRHRALRRAGLRDRATHPRNRYSDGPGGTAQQRHAAGAGGCAVACRRQHRRKSAGFSAAGAAVAQRAVWGQPQRSAHALVGNFAGLRCGFSGSSHPRSPSGLGRSHEGAAERVRATRG